MSDLSPIGRRDSSLAAPVCATVGWTDLDVRAVDTARVLGTGLLTAAMLGLGADVHVATLVRTGGRAVALGAAATAVTASVSLAGIYLLA